jgi:hypothetical protein
MTDRELLEAAAKAAGFDYECTSHTGCPEDDQHQIRSNSGSLIEWNPLTDDGDALRISVTLGLKIEHYSVTSEGRCRVGAGVGYAPVTYEGDPYAATRRAIVRAAAEIGKAMK